MNQDTPILPLDLWRDVIQYHPWHFWGMATDTIPGLKLTSNCNSLVYEYGWQGTDQAGREDVRNAIMNAEKILYDNLVFWPAPAYGDQILDWPRYNNQRLMRLGRMDARGKWIPLILKEGEIRNLGIEAFTSLDPAALLVFSDEDGDGLNDTFTTTVATTVTDPNEIAVYFTAADRLSTDNSLSARWRIEPVKVSISAGTATIKGKRWLIVKPVIYQDKDHYPIDPTIAANFITTVHIYRRYTYRDGVDALTDSQAALIWESHPCWWGCSNPAGSSDPSAEGWVAGRGDVKNSTDGIVSAAEAVYNATTGTWSGPSDCFAACSGEPDRVLIRYLGGLELDKDGWMQRSMRTTVARLAAAEMTRRICACDQANREFSNWQQDVSRITGPETYQAGLTVLDNPLGTRRGHIYAWQQIKSLARTVGTLV